VHSINSEKVASTSVLDEAIELWSCKHNARAEAGGEWISTPLLSAKV